MALIREMPVSAAAAMMGEHDTRLWRIVRHYVGAAHARQDWGGVAAVAIDETATRKEHRYATVAVEIDPEGRRAARLLFMTPERTAGSVGEFVAAMPAHGAAPAQVRIAAIDMSAACRRGGGRTSAPRTGDLRALPCDEAGRGSPRRRAQNTCTAREPM